VSTIDTSVTPESWAPEFLALMGDNPSANSETAVEAWEGGEGGAGPQWGNPKNLASYNPLNSTLPAPAGDSYDTNPPGQPAIQAYSSWQEGLQTTASTLKEDQPGYAQIRADLATGADPAQTYQDIDKSAWGTHDLGTGSQPESANAATSPASAQTTSFISSAGNDVLSLLGLSSAGNDIAKVGLWLVLAGGAVVLAVLGAKQLTSSSQTLQEVKSMSPSQGLDKLSGGSGALDEAAVAA
jgi:hypothetical protein